MKTFQLNTWYSNFTEADLANIQAQIIDATRQLEEARAAYNLSISVGHEYTAEKYRRPAVDEAKKYLDSLLDTFERMQTSVSVDQNQDLVDISAAQASGALDPVPDSEQYRPYIYVGAGILVLFLIYKLM